MCARTSVSTGVSTGASAGGLTYGGHSQSGSQQNNHNDICVFYLIKESAEGSKYISLKAPGNRQASRCNHYPAFFFFKGHTMGGAHTPAPKNVPRAK